MSNFLDIRTLSMVMGLTSVIMAVIMVYNSMTRRTYTGFHYWTMSFVLGGLGLILLSLRHMAPDWVTILAANFCILAFPSLLAVGLAKFQDKPCLWWLLIAVVALAMIAMTFFTYSQPNVTARIMVISITTSLLMAYCLVLQQGVRRRLGFSNKLLTVAFSFLALWMAMRAVLTPVLGGHIADFLSSGTLQALSFVISILSFLLIMGGLITLNAQRMESELASADEKIEDMSRLIPICASCKKIRDDQGYWQAVESYIQKMTKSDLTHSICPECTKKLYPEIKLKEK